MPSAASPGGRWPSPCGSDPGSSDIEEESDDRRACRSYTTVQKNQFLGSESSASSGSEGSEGETRSINHSHAAELQAVGVGLMVRGQVVVVKDPDPKHSGVNTGAKEKDGDEARHLVDRPDVTLENKVLTRVQ